ncbi:MAG: hypothetical protein UW88_C0010G0010 [Candidatus Collierbacteria bacterium GW2011_GWD2_45_10]|nr:MAG: hypothetical protein UW58_C0012G0022 [Candidatus Collierbacteria bacterium GW2011_GWC2_44_30]KKT88534.1 MAG: hypothetical protein UW88_C0010G0010 [Candidatus Collierbacteria bacterium GW2011_GWD2_45_10]
MVKAVAAEVVAETVSFRTAGDRFPETRCQLLLPKGIPFIRYCPVMSTLPLLVTVNFVVPETEAEIRSPVLVWLTVRAGQPAAEVAFILVRPSTAT